MTSFTPFILFSPTKNLILIPTPQAINSAAYRRMYAALHASAEFTSMGFGTSWGTRQWSDQECKEHIQTRDVTRSWEKRGMGDFALGILPLSHLSASQEPETLNILSGSQYTQFVGDEGSDAFLERITWIGYAGIRDATTTSMPVSERDFPHWLEMVEVRYGIHPDYWGKGYARRAAEAVM
ncbi:hypothetical protein LSUE1_G003787, partial [Lachnellula suecica]